MNMDMTWHHASQSTSWTKEPSTTRYTQQPITPSISKFSTRLHSCLLSEISIRLSIHANEVLHKRHTSPIFAAPHPIASAVLHERPSKIWKNSSVVCNSSYRENDNQRAITSKLQSNTYLYLAPIQTLPHQCSFLKPYYQKNRQIKKMGQKKFQNQVA